MVLLLGWVHFEQFCIIKLKKEQSKKKTSGLFQSVLCEAEPTRSNFQGQFVFFGRGDVFTGHRLEETLRNNHQLYIYTNLRDEAATQLAESWVQHPAARVHRSEAELWFHRTLNTTVNISASHRCLAVSLTAEASAVVKVNSDCQW